MRKNAFKGLGFMTETHLDTVYIYTERKGQRNKNYKSIQPIHYI